MITFDPPPSNVTVLEGETATFTCVPKVNGSALRQIFWHMTPPVNGWVARQTVNLINTTTLQGASGVFIRPDLSQLYITKVQRIADQTTVECRGRSTVLLKYSPAVFLNVQSESFPLNQYSNWLHGLPYLCIYYSEI